MSPNIYDIAFKRLARWLIPKRRRSDSMMAWVLALIIPVITLHQFFLKYRKAKLYQLMITPQVCYLEMLLNDRFDFVQRRIRIDDAIWFQAWYLYQEAELKPKYVYQDSENNPVYLYTDGEAGTLRDDFVVLVPAAVVFDHSEMRSVIDGYRLAGKKYKIEII